MSILHRTRNNLTDQNPAPAAPVAEAPFKTQAQPAAGTRTSMAWAGVWTGAIVFTVLIVFMLQNTRGVQVSFLGWDGTLPLAMALLIATIGGMLFTLVVGTARITQLRHLARRRRR